MNAGPTLRRCCVLLLLLALGGCYVAGHTSSPWEWGGGVRAAPGLWSVGNGDATIHPTVGYTYLSFDGGTDNLFELGAQMRFPMAQQSDMQFWVGGEATYSHLRTSFDEDALPTHSNNGWSITGLVGMPFGESRWGTNLFAGAGITDYGASGWNVRFGVDLQPTFLWSN